MELTTEELEMLAAWHFYREDSNGCFALPTPLKEEGEGFFPLFVWKDSGVSWMRYNAGFLRGAIPIEPTEAAQSHPRLLEAVLKCEREMRAAQSRA